MSHCFEYEKSGHKMGFDRVVLLSGSPRRRELLSFLKPEVQAREIDERSIEEHFMKFYEKEDFVTRVAKTCCEISKAKSEMPLEERTLYISADTMVIFKDRVYNKPLSREEAREMFMSYFGKTHHVVTSVCLRTSTYLEVFYCLARVTFVSYYEALGEVVDAYLDSDTIFDKAGAYGFQELDPRFILEISGDPHTIIGLPVAITASKINQIALAN